jgi:hypothetical protein
MLVSHSLPLLWAQTFFQGIPPRFVPLMKWLYLFGEPTVTLPLTTGLLTALLGGLLYWIKVVSLLCLLGWVVSWLTTALKERSVARGTWLDVAALVALIGGIGTVLLRILETTQRVNIYKLSIRGLPEMYTVTILAAICLAVLFLWIETAVWLAIRRSGRYGDLFVLVGVHLALALGMGVGFTIRWANNTISQTNAALPVASWSDGLILGFRLGATYMGYVVLARVLFMILGEIASVRWRRLFSIARVSVLEANRRMWAPWVVITVFLVILAFTHWFLQPPRPAEMGRLYVTTLSLLCTLLLTLMVTFLTPLSLPQDIQSQTIYTVVSKPVRRIELIWGRMLGFMALVTVLVLFFGAISLAYLWRTVGGTIEATVAAARKMESLNKLTEARQLYEQAQQLRTRMTARVPVYGALTFLDSKGTPHHRGIDVGQDQSTREPRSHIEGATPATAIWTYGIVPDPYTPPGERPRLMDKRIPLELLLRRDTMEELLNRSYELKYQATTAEQQQMQGNLPVAEARRLTASAARARDELSRVNAAYEKLKGQSDDLSAQITAAEAAGESAESLTLLRQRLAALHSPDIELEMTFNVYRTTKGRIGEPVYAEIEVTNLSNPQAEPYRNIFPIREYYTNHLPVPSKVLAGSLGALKVEIRCISPTQYLGMAETDLFLLAHSGDFGTNFMKGLFGIWLQAMVLTAIGVFAGTFLSWPVALLTTLAFFIGGWVAFAFLLGFTSPQTMLGGGPFESLIRLISHDNQMSELTPTLAVVTAKTLDAMVMPIMSRLVYIVPNFAALDVSNTVADGFAVSWSLMGVNFLLAIAYSLPFSIAGYFILKNREVAA